MEQIMMLKITASAPKGDKITVLIEMYVMHLIT